MIIKMHRIPLKETGVIVENLLPTSYPEGFGLEPKPRMTPYHQVFLSSSEEVKEKGGEDFPSLSDGMLILLFGVGVRRGGEGVLVESGT